MVVGENLGEVSQILPGDLVERIVAMVPFPYIFKARGLLKSWLARFSPIPSQSDEAQKSLAASFQNQVGKWSNSWESFSPVLIGKENALAYDRASQNSAKLPSLSFLPDNLFLGNQFLSRLYWRMEGTLLYGFPWSKTGTGMHNLYVANVLTRTWKLLPACPLRTSYVSCNNLVIDPSTETYNLILLSCGGSGYFAQIYDSKSETWNSKDFAVSGDFSVGPSTATNLNGVLYMVAVNNPQIVLVMSTEEGTSEELRFHVTTYSRMSASTWWFASRIG